MRWRIATFLITVAALVVAAVSSAGCDTPEPGPRLQGQVRMTFLHTSDIHSRLFPYDLQIGHIDSGLGLGEIENISSVGGAARISHIIGRERARSERVLHLDGGDCFQGAPVFNFFSGEAEIRALSRRWASTGMIVANHEFDHGALNLGIQLQKWANYPVLVANYKLEDRVPARRIPQLGSGGAALPHRVQPRRPASVGRHRHGQPVQPHLHLRPAQPPRRVLPLKTSPRWRSSTSIFLRPHRRSGGGGHPPRSRVGPAHDRRRPRGSTWCSAATTTSCCSPPSGCVTAPTWIAPAPSGASTMATGARSDLCIFEDCHCVEVVSSVTPAIMSTMVCDPEAAGVHGQTFTARCADPAAHATSCSPTRAPSPSTWAGSTSSPPTRPVDFAGRAFHTARFNGLRDRHPQPTRLFPINATVPEDPIVKPGARALCPGASTSWPTSICLVGYSPDGSRRFSSHRRRFAPGQHDRRRPCGCASACRRTSR